MSITVGGNNGTNKQTEVYLDLLPHKCPFCHRSIRPVPVYGFLNGKIWQVMFHCPDKDCGESFIGYYAVIGSTSSTSYLNRTSFGNLEIRQFPTAITDTSESFVKIYNESYSAEQRGLLEICGVGYRKSLEFLIKDYAIKKHPSEKDAIETRPLMQCIKQYVSDERIKKVAQRATWLGNDETHYVRKWEGKNLDDLKRLIDLTLYWIESEVLTQFFEYEMPDG